jgi:hypothetical protein
MNAAAENFRDITLMKLPSIWQPVDVTEPDLRSAEHY